MPFFLLWAEYLMKLVNFGSVFEFSLSAHPHDVMKVSSNTISQGSFQLVYWIALRIALPTPLAEAGFCPVIRRPSTTTFAYNRISN